MADPFDRVGIVVHPSRALHRALATIEAWASGTGTELVRLGDDDPQDAEQAASCDLVLAVGGDGTTLAALHAAAPARRPVLGVACGSLGALTAVTAGDLDDALDRVAAGRTGLRTLPALRVTGAVGDPQTAFNDLVLVRRGAGQVIVHVAVEGERVMRFAGDGLVVATALGSTGYTLAVGGPVLEPGGDDVVTTPLAPHGGFCPAVVTRAGRTLTITLEPGYGGARVEIDGRPRATLEPPGPGVFEVVHDAHAGRLVVLEDGEPFWAGLRRRRIVIDSPRILARDDREAAAGARGT